MTKAYLDPEKPSVLMVHIRWSLVPLASNVLCAEPPEPFREFLASLPTEHLIGVLFVVQRLLKTRGELVVDVGEN